MADIKTAKEWSEVAAKLKSNRDAIGAEGALVEQGAREASGIVRVLPDEIARARLAGNNDLADKLTIELAQAVEQRDTLDIRLKQLDGKYAELNDQYLEADAQVAFAEDAPPGTLADPVTSVNPPPVNAEPGNNTDVPTVRDDINSLAIAKQQQELVINGNGLPVGSSDETAPTYSETLQEERDRLRAEALAIATAKQQEEEFTGGGTVSGTQRARNSGNARQFLPFPKAPDYRVRITLAPTATYLYNDPEVQTNLNHILRPLYFTRGVIFPYTPTINVSYVANYSPTELTHSNYKIYNYSSSSVENINITGMFTAQDVVEANYLLAVMHFFKCVTKMFYGKDQSPFHGVPPPLVYLSGHGEFGFDNHPMVITNFTLNYPEDVDYINTGPTYFTNSAFNSYSRPTSVANTASSRLAGAKLQPGGLNLPPAFNITNNTTTGITRVPTKLQIQLNALPVVTRKDISNNFSLKEYASGSLLRGSTRPQGGGIW